MVYKDTKIEFFKIKKELFFGFEYVWYENYQIPIAKAEKAIIDILYFGYSPKGFEIDYSKIDCNTLKGYAKSVKKNSIIRKIREIIDC